MSLTERIAEDLKTAMRARDSERLAVLRMIKSRLQNEAIEVGGPLGPEAEVQVLMRLVKQRRESIEQFQKFGRTQQAEAEAREMAVVEEYLPSAPTSEELQTAIDEVRAALPEPASRQMGPIMQRVMALFQGRPVDGKEVSALVRQSLGA